MSAGGQGELPPRTVSMREAARDAARWALVAFGLCFPIVLLRTDQDLSNRIVLHARPWLTLNADFGGRKPRTCRSDAAIRPNSSLTSRLMLLSDVTFSSSCRTLHWHSGGCFATSGPVESSSFTNWTGQAHDPFPPLQLTIGYAIF